MAESRTQVHIFPSSEKMTEECQRAVEALSEESILALDSEGVNLGKDGPLTLLQIGTLSGTVYLFDVMWDEMTQDKAYFKDTGLDELLTSKKTIKVIQSCAGDSAALYHQFGIRLENIFDTQVAHLVIEEHKGRLLPSRIKLEEICKKYSKHATVYEKKDHLKDIWTKKEGNFWAKRPMTKEMIEYASCDVTALIPEVFETQKRYIDAHDLWDKYQQRVQEEIDFYIDPTARERRLQRNIEMRGEILNSMSAKYQLGFDFNLISDEDEKKAIEDVSLREINDFPVLVRDLKKQAIRRYLQKLEDDLTRQDTFEPERFLTAKLHEIERYGDTDLKSEAVRLKAKVTEIVTRDMEQKYDTNTSVEVLTVTEMNVLQWLNPLSRMSQGPTVIRLYRLHWKATYENLCKEIEEYMQGKMKVTDSYISRIGFLANNQNVPLDVKEKAREFQNLLQRHQSRRR